MKMSEFYIKLIWVLFIDITNGNGIFTQNH